ncbi:MAG TPA: peptide-N-glycosidase F-related protein [Saprospiraceae bacterium]|nr:peptide-N-glycosidase F-related protein [Saprospiraceae bacterium]HMQ81492.1 peptide-N-glycosidase F-related protein [Saprospiraceae bacterium]
MKKMLQLFLMAFILFGYSRMDAQSNQYLHFDRVDDYVETVNGSGYIANSNQITMAGWFYHDQLGYGQGLMSIRGGGTGTGEMYLIQLNDGTLESRLITTAGFHEYVAPSFSIVPETWQHVAWVYNGSTVALYIDGVLKGSAAATGTITATNKPFTIGKCLLGGFNFVFGGRADEVSLWNKALTQQEIQDMMENELTGSEEGLQLYYKFNQGVPGEDNTSITKLDSEVGGSERDGDLIGFALTGDVSNFGGELDESFQAITFPQIPNKLISDPAFDLNASASSGLPVSYEIVSGPATLSGNTVTLTGVAGEVVIKASQAGDGTFDPAADAFNTFQVIDPALNVPHIDARNPLPGDVYVPQLKAIQLAAIADIDYQELFSVTGLKFEINGLEITPTDWGNKHYSAWWTPPGYGSYALKIIATNNYGASATETVNINVVNQVEDMTVTAVSEVWADVNNGIVEVEAELPSYTGAFDQISGYLNITCPPGGCDPWDRISGLEVKGHNGEWYEIIRYITPYGVACGHSIDLTDFMSLLQGKIRFRVYLGTLGNGFLYSLDLDYAQGTPAHPFSSVTEVWKETYNFGNPLNLQPVPEKTVAFPENTEAAILKLVSTGHGWGENNTGNAAEFHDDTHHIWVNGVQTFEQRNWNDCNPNPDGCQPQNGTWFYDRAGWCPGTIAPWFDFDMNSFVGASSVNLDYVFDEDYIDMCNADYANCVSGVTCPNCDDGFNPHLIVSCYLISLGDEPIDGAVTGLNDPLEAEMAWRIYPNPASERFQLSFSEVVDDMVLSIYNSAGQRMLMQQKAQVSSQEVDISQLPLGVYTVEVRTEQGVAIQKLVIE